MDRKQVPENRRLFRMLDSQSILLWSQIFTLEPRKVRESNILGFYICVRSGDADALERAYNKVIETNDSLRLRFCRAGGLKIRQYIDDFAYSALARRRLPDRRAFEDYLGQIGHNLIPMFGGQLTWAEIVTYGDGFTALVMRFHHLVMDGYSISLIFSRIAEAYEQYIQGIEPRPRQYSITRSFEQHEKYGKSAAHAEDRVFWRKCYNTQPRYSFPAGRRAPKGACAIREISVGGEMYRNLTALSSELCCSVQSLILSAAAYTVYRLTGKTNFCLCSLTHGRFDPDARRTVGCLMNVVPVFFNLDTDREFRASLQEEYMNFLETLKHGRLSISEQTPMSYKEPILHGFNFNHEWILVSAMEYGAAFSKSAYEAKMITATNQPYQFYAMVLEVPGERIDIRLRYQTHKFSSEQAGRFLQAFLDVMDRMTSSPGAKISSVREKAAVPLPETAEPRGEVSGE